MKDWNSAWRLVALAALTTGPVLLAGCNKSGGNHSQQSQVAATVNDTEISVHQIQAALQREPQLGAQLGEAAGQRVAQSLVEQELAAQAARHDGLDSDPAVLQTMELAKREVLARAYQDRLATKVESPPTAEIDRYYDAHPLLFAQRKQYTLQEMTVEGTPEAIATLAERISRATGADDVTQAVQGSGLRFAARQAIRYAEELPASSLERISQMPAGQSVLVARDGGATILTLMRVDPANVERQAARASVTNILMAERRREQVARAMSALRDAARVHYFGRFQPGAAASQPAAQSVSDLAAPAPLSAAPEASTASDAGAVAPAAASSMP